MFTEDRDPENRGGNYSDIRDDHPDLPRRLFRGSGFCTRIQENVRDEGCTKCFYEVEHLVLRKAFSIDGRRGCVERHIQIPVKQSTRDALLARVGPMLKALDPEDAKAVLVNLFESAAMNPDEQTSQAYFRQVRAHYEQEVPHVG